MGGGLDASFGVGFGRSGLGISGGGKVGIEGRKIDREAANLQSQHQQAFDEAYNAFTEEQAREAWSLNEQVRSAEQARHSQSATTGKSEGTTAGVAQESGRQYGLRQAAAKLESLSQQISRSQGRSVSLSQDQTAALINYISGQSRAPKGMVVQAIAEAAESGRLHTTRVGGKSVADWIGEWQDRNPQLDGRETADLSEKGSSLGRSVESRIQNQSEVVPHEQRKIESQVEDRKAGIQEGIQKESAHLQGAIENKKDNVERIRGEIGSEISSGKTGVSEKKLEVRRTGEVQKDRMEKFQEKGVSLDRVTAEGILNPFRDSSDGQVSQGRKEIFPEGVGSPHPNFFAESRLESLRKMQDSPDKGQEFIEEQRSEMQKRLDNIYQNIEKLDEEKKIKDK